GGAVRDTGEARSEPRRLVRASICRARSADYAATRDQQHGRRGGGDGEGAERASHVLGPVQTGGHMIEGVPTEASLAPAPCSLAYWPRWLPPRASRRPIRSPCRTASTTSSARSSPPAARRSRGSTHGRPIRSTR